MSVQSIGQDSSSSSWLTQLLANMQGQSTTGQASASSLFGLTEVASDTSGSSAAATSSGSASSGSSVGSFNDILAALLSGNGALGYDMQTGTLTNLAASGEAAASDSGTESDGLTREITETDNADGSLSRSVKVTDADGNVVGTEQTTQKADGSFTTVATVVGPDGKTITRTITGENTSDGGFSVTNTLTNAAGTVFEKGTELTAADGSVTRSLTRTTPDGQTLTDSEAFDADGNIISTTSSVTGAVTTASASDTTSASGSSESSAAASGSSDSSSSSSENSDTTTTVSTLFTSEGLTQTTTVTDATGKILSQNTKEIPFSATADSQSYGPSEGSKKGVSGVIDQYAANRYGTSRYAAQQALSESSGQSSSLSVQA